MRVKLSLMGDWCMPLPILLSAHEALCVEAPTPIMWGPGSALQQNKLTKTVFHKSQSMALDGHDCGHWIPHIWAPPFPPPPLSLKLALIIAFSKRKMMFSSSTVKAEDSQVGCAQFSGGMLVPMQTCGSPISPPTTFPVFNFLHTVSVNMTVGDLVAGFVAIALSMAGDALGRMKALGPGLEGLAKELLGAGNFQKHCLKVAIGILVGGARVAATQEGELKIEAFSVYTRLEGSIETRRDGRMGFSAKGQVFTGHGIRQDRVSHAYAEGGKVVRKHSTTSATMEHSQVTTTTDTFDGKGSREKSKTETWGPSL